MFSISISKILPLYPTRAYIEFEVDGVEHLSVPVPTLDFVIQRSEINSVEADWEVLNPLGTTKFYYIDTNPRLLSFYNTVYYRVMTEFSGTKYFTDPTTVTRQLRRDEFLRRRKILYDEEIVLRKFSGRKIAILRRRHIGDRCTECYDPNTRMPTKSHCRTCKGTGFIDPYYEPFITYGARIPATKEVDELQPESANEADITRIQILDYPTVQPQDLLIDLEVNDRYKIMKIEPTEMRRHIVHQELVISKLARTSAEYAIPIAHNLLELPSSISL